MKLDKTIVEKISEFVSRFDYERQLDSSTRDVSDFLSSLDLVIKPGDSSQGTLVENFVGCNCGAEIKK